MRLFLDSQEIVLKSWSKKAFYRVDTKKKSGLEDTQPHHGAQRRAMEFDRPVDEELGAALGGVEDKDRSHDDEVPELCPEQQIQNEEEIRTPPRREPRRVENLPPRGLVRGGTNRFRVRGT